MEMVRFIVWCGVCMWCAAKSQWRKTIFFYFSKKKGTRNMFTPIAARFATENIRPPPASSIRVHARRQTVPRAAWSATRFSWPLRPSAAFLKAFLQFC